MKFFVILFFIFSFFFLCHAPVLADTTVTFSLVILPEPEAPNSVTPADLKADLSLADTVPAAIGPAEHQLVSDAAVPGSPAGIDCSNNHLVVNFSQ